MAKAKHLEYELQVARYFTSFLKYPEQVRGLPREYGYGFIDGAARYFQANNINPSAKGVPPQLLAKYPQLLYLGDKDFSLLDILAWARHIAASDPARLW